MENFMDHFCFRPTVLKRATTKINKQTFYYKGNFVEVCRIEL